MPKKSELVRYISPYSSPAWMARELARKYFDVDDERYLRDAHAGNLTDEQKRIGPPRIEDPTSGYNAELREWDSALKADRNTV